MSVSPAVSATTYNLGGTSLGPYATVFPYDVDASVTAFLDLNDGNGPRALGAGSDYTIADLIPLVTGGNVRLNADLRVGGSWPTGSKLSLVRGTPEAQPAIFPEQGPFSPSVMEGALDNLTRQIQDVSTAQAQVLKLPIGEIAGALPAAIARQGKLLMFGDFTGAPDVVALADILPPGAGGALPGPAFGTVLQLASGVGLAPYTVLQLNGFYAAGDCQPFAVFRSAGVPAAGNGLYADGEGGVWQFSGNIALAEQLGMHGTGLGHDDTAILIGIFANWLAPGRTLIFSKSYYTNGCILNTAGGHISLAAPTFLVGDSGAPGTISNTASGKINWLFQCGANRLTITGAGWFLGQGVIGQTIGVSTSLAGMVFDTCTNVRCPAQLNFDTMAAGRMVAWSSGHFGDVYATNMNGLQTLSSPTAPAGTAEVVFGCNDSRFGDVVAPLCYKPGRYLSLALNGAAQAIDNQRCKFGSTQSTQPTGGSNESSALSVRSAVDCSFGAVIASGTSNGLIVNQFAGDEAFNVNRIDIESVTGTVVATTASLDTAINIATTSTTKNLGKIGIGRIETVAGAGCEFGAFITAGDVTLGEADINGGVRALWLTGTAALPTKFRFGSLKLGGQNQEALYFGNGVNIRGGYVDLYTGSGSGSSGSFTGIRYDVAQGSGGYGDVSWAEIRYRQNGVGANFSYPYFDPTNGFQAAQIGHMDGVGASGQARFGTDAVTIWRGHVGGAAPPTSTNATKPAPIFENTGVTAATTPAWMLTTAPTTWTALPNL